MAWIKFEKDLLTDPRVLRIARNLESKFSSIGNAQALPAVTLVCGALVRIWSLADTHLDSDDLLPLGFGELDEVVGIPGFCALVPSDWLVEIDEHTVKLPNFHAHNGTEAKKKAVTQKRVARHRAALQGGNGRALPDQTRPRPDKTIVKDHVGASAPTGDQSPVVETLPTNNGREYQVRQSFVAQLEPLYPAVDVPATIREMKGWLLGNPHRRKTPRGTPAFITGWLKREQEKANGAAPG